MGRFNAIALPPPQSYYQGSLTRGTSNCQPPCHVAPHTGVRMDPCGLLPCVRVLCATCASRGLARPCHMALHATLHTRRSRVPRQLCAPHQLRGVCGIKTPFFDFFNYKIHLKNQIKIRKRVETSEIYNFKNTTPFNLKCSPLYHNFIPF